MGGINHQKWELDYCYTHIIDNTQMSYVLILRWCLHLHPEKLCTAAPCHGWPHGRCCHGCNWRILCDGNGRIHQKNSGNSGKISKMGGSEFMIFFFFYLLLHSVRSCWVLPAWVKLGDWASKTLPSWQCNKSGIHLRGFSTWDVLKSPTPGSA